MNKYILLIILSVNPFLTKANTLPLSSLKNPFEFVELVPCEELETIFVSQLNLWRFIGVIHTMHPSHKMVVILESTDLAQWLQLSNDIVPVRLLPWKISVISSQRIEWQVDLPIYCDKQLMVSMPLGGK